MKKTDELKEVLDKLKSEIGSSGQLSSDGYMRLKSGSPGKANHRGYLPEAKSYFPRTERQDMQKFNEVWSENKEALLFGILVSVIMSALGLLGRQEILIIAGAAAFLLFCLISFMAFFRYISSASSRARVPEELLERLAVLEEKPDVVQSVTGRHTGPLEKRMNEMEQKLAELKLIVKTIAQKR